MSNEVASLRKQAADEFRAARHSKSPEDRQAHETKARGFRLLAENEAWLTGKNKRIRLQAGLRSK
jgi:hypothetical protein